LKLIGLELLLRYTMASVGLKKTCYCLLGGNRTLELLTLLLT